MDSKDLQKYDLTISDIQDEDARDIVGEKLQDILEDINDELGEDEKLIFDVPLNVEMYTGNADSILIRIHLPVVKNEENSLHESIKASALNRNEVKDIAFSFHSLNECIDFAKQIQLLEKTLIERAKKIAEEELMVAKEEELEIPESIPENMQAYFENIRKKFVEMVNQSLEQEYERAQNFNGLNTSLYKMKDVYYFICRDISLNAMQGIPEEFYLGSIEAEPSASYIEEHGEIIIKEKATDSLAML